MRRRRKKRGLRPRLPARTKKKRRAKKHGRQHPELIGLGLVAFGIFIGAVLYLGWSGGYVGEWIADAYKVLIGSLAYALPVLFAAERTCSSTSPSWSAMERNSSA